MRQKKISKVPFNKVVDRRLKVFWAIKKLQHNYFTYKKRYSLRNVVMMVNSILEKKGFKSVTKRTIQSDIKNIEKIGLLKISFNPLGKNNGSFTYYIINKALEKVANKAISTAYFLQKKEDAEKAINKAINKDKLKEQEQQFKISHQIFSRLLSDIKVNYYKYKNSNIKNSDFKNIKNENYESKEKNLERIILQRFKIKKSDLSEIRDIVKTQVSYKNTLWNLKDFMEELKEYNENDALNFFKAVLKKKKNKIWFMAKKGIKTDFHLIIGKFKDENKTKAQQLCQNHKRGEKTKMGYIDSPNEIIKMSNVIADIIKIKELISS
ncbi:plasmid maintenance protein [Borrelia persica]|uniref:plasmid maintenance protein n=1 Tax=Borrelia persica TaxID=44448 RepID=UPI0004671399|nr:plasmid maintenance protein [Borrelia persica]